MDINFNGSLTDITAVNFDGNTDITYINLNGTVVWTKAASAVDVLTALVADTGGINSDSRTYTVQTDMLKVNNIIQNSSGQANYTASGLDFSTYSSPFQNGPSTTVVAIHTGCHASIASTLFTGMEYTPTGGSSTAMTMDTEIGWAADHGNMKVRTATVDHSIGDIEAYKYTRGSVSDGASGGKDYSLILPNQWEATTVSADGAGSISLGSGEILLIANLDIGPDSYDGGNDVSNTVTEGSNSMVLESAWWWYQNGSLGIYANTTESSQTISWTDTGYYVRVIKLTQTGI